MTVEPTFKIVCSPEDHAHTSDSVLMTADCGHSVWIAPTNRRNVENPFMKTQTLCLRCVVHDPDLPSLLKDGIYTFPGVRDELNAELGVAETDQLFARLRVREYRE